MTRRVGYFAQAAYRDVATGHVYLTGPVHDADRVPSEALERCEAGFFGHDGKFYTRGEAAESVIRRRRLRGEEADDVRIMDGSGVHSVDEVRDVPVVAGAAGYMATWLEERH